MVERLDVYQTQELIVSEDDFVNEAESHVSRSRSLNAVAPKGNKRRLKGSILSKQLMGEVLESICSGHLLGLRIVCLQTFLFAPLDSSIWIGW
jgi:hypothetical protein